LHIESVVRGGLLTLRVSAAGREGVESGILNGAPDVAAGVSVESSWQVLVVPGDGSHSAIAGELHTDVVIDPVNPAVEGSGHNQLDYLFVLLVGSRAVRARSDTEHSLIIARIGSVSIVYSKPESSSDVRSTREDSFFAAAEERRQIAEGKFRKRDSTDPIPRLVVLSLEASGQIGRSQEVILSGDTGAEQEDSQKIFDHDFIYIYCPITSTYKLIQRISKRPPTVEQPIPYPFFQSFLKSYPLSEAYC
jgi:hypothetical protein